ncbi:hypothetical protein NGRA_1474 [Nosema granulosis]|uniref:Uncharacterized protein n=1 Tax=Nosema granulosis TaxID=83296 RepID=A0A9P6GZZ5_9MICR|nr:hypothetical protein NGRA_1474 [Nosema granulosis]
MSRKKKILKLQITECLNKIEALKSLISNEQEFLVKITDLHRAYRSLMASFENVEYKKRDIEEIEGDGFCSFKLGDMNIVFSDSLGILSVDMGNQAINKHVFDQIKKYNLNLQKNKVVEYLCIYEGFNSTKCNICGTFLIPQDLSIPIIKEIEQGEILSFHVECYTPDSVYG